ncbi:hypothetical protein EW026_g4374 [Hermanssonia centrifuga]|uniref:Uncharacterized protein n=1 Tax=Hermanssonia centrifuga TaxID=98765 RepID=A0A4S4KJ39_9APHY|nr:hypothetical protein EW026_g4374 [Hermanssonia centrifuga]
MPGPAVYVVVAALGTVAAVLAFKEFVYDPHIAPQFDAWSNAIVEHRRRNRARRRGPVAVPSMSEASNPSPPRTGAVPDKKGSDDDDSMSIELEDLVAKEVAEWKSPNAQGTLRHRKTKSSNVLDESNVFVPYDPISPTLTDSSAPSSPSAGPSRPTDHKLIYTTRRTQPLTKGTCLLHPSILH